MKVMHNRFFAIFLLVTLLIIYMGCDDDSKTPVSSGIPYDPESPESILPLSVGNYWQYFAEINLSTDPAPRTGSVEITGFGTEFDGRTSYTLDQQDSTVALPDYFHYDPYVAVSGDSVLYYKNNGWLTMPDLLGYGSYATGDTLEIIPNYTLAHALIIVIDTDATVITEAGTFTDCYVIQQIFSPGGDDPLRKDRYYAPGVGLVYEEATFDLSGPKYTRELVSYQIL